jgi:hypothetical protein
VVFPGRVEISYQTQLPLELSGLQRDVLSLYRKCLREIRNKPEVGSIASHLIFNMKREKACKSLDGAGCVSRSEEKVVFPGRVEISYQTQEEVRGEAGSDMISPLGRERPLFPQSGKHTQLRPISYQTQLPLELPPTSPYFIFHNVYFYCELKINLYLNRNK